MSREAFTSLCDTLASWLACPPDHPPEWPNETWELWRQAARVHGLAPLLWLQLRDVPPWAESPAGSWLADQYAWNARRVARLQSELVQVLQVFATAGVPILPVKGAVLAARYYEDAAARPMADLDLVLREEHFPVGEELLGGLGYEKVFSGWKHARFSRRGGSGIVDCECEHPDNPRQLEVHPRCRERIRDEVVDLTDCMWAEARPGELLGTPAWLPEVDILWLYLLVHATHHILLNTFRLLQLTDLMRLEPALREPAASLRSVDARATYPVQALLQRYFPSECRGELLACQRSRVSPAFAAWADELDLYEVCHLNPAPWRAG